jgi:hypothetical protein
MLNCSRKIAQRLSHWLLKCGEVGQSACLLVRAELSEVRRNWNQTLQGEASKSNTDNVLATKVILFSLLIF